MFRRKLSHLCLALVTACLVAGPLGGQRPSQPDDTWAVTKGNEADGAPFAFAWFNTRPPSSIVPSSVIVRCTPHSATIQFQLLNAFPTPERDQDGYRILSEKQDRMLSPKGKVTLSSDGGAILVASGARNVSYNQSSYFIERGASLMPAFATGKPLLVGADSKYAPAATIFPFDSTTPPTLRAMFEYCRLPMPPGFRTSKRRK